MESKNASFLFYSFLYAAFFAVIQGLFYFIRARATGPQAMGHIREMWTLTNIEVFMLLWSRLIWHRLGQLARKFERKFLQDAAMTLTALLLLSSHLSFAFYYITVGSQEEPHPLTTFCLVSWAFTAHLFSFLFACVIGRRIAYWLHARPWGRALLTPFLEIPPVSTFIFNTKIQTAICIGVALLATAVGFRNANSLPEVREVSVKVSNLPSHLNEFKIAHVSDMHIGPVVGRKKVQAVVDLVNGLGANVVSLAGDLVDGDAATLWPAVEPIKDLKTTHGVYFTTGNHEYYFGRVDKWFEYLESIGVHPLHNTHVKLKGTDGSEGQQKQDGVLCFAGVDDYTAAKSGLEGHELNIDKALKGCNTETSSVIVMCHQPRGARKILTSTKHKIDLILVGHTHGGQFWLLAPMTWMTNPFFLGLYKHSSGAQVYVSSGVHFWGPPVKHPSSEITLFTLKKA